MRKVVKKLTDEAASHFVGRLLSLRKSRKVSWLKLSRELDVTPETIYRWRSGGAIPAERAVAVCRILKIQEPRDLEGVDLSGPQHFCRALRRTVPSAAREHAVNGRQVVGYAAVWLSSRLVGVDVVPLVSPVLGSDERPVSRLMLHDQQGVVLAHIQFEVTEERLVYSAFSHRAGVPLLEFEGVADQLGFDFCLEFLESKAGKTAIKRASAFDRLERHIIKNHAKQRRATAPATGGD